MNKNTIIAIIAVIVVIGGGVAYVSSSSKSTDHASIKPSATATADQPVDTNSVVISNYTFNPTPLKVKKGTKVTWTNHDIAKHSIVVDSGTGPQSDLFGKSQTYSYTFDVVGTYKYHCEPHPYMHGTVEVTE
jgi:amicyanin